jgi:DNA-binding NtrC family response regulator
MPFISGDSTLKPDAGRSTAGAAPRQVPALTILWHPVLERVGGVALLEDLALAQPKAVTVSRLAPLFTPPAGGDALDLGDLFLSRTPGLELVPLPRGQLELRLGPAGAEVEVQGAPLSRALTITPAEVEGGVVIAIGRIALCLHMVTLPFSRGPALGLVGGGQPLEQVRQQIRRVADLDVPVLIRGETGTGKELVARALVTASRRADKPFVAVNMATIPPSVAAAELFGHERGAFTGAAGARSGFFGEAAGGTLFLDEVGLTPPDVQAMLLRVLETGEVLPLGSGRPRKLDVRVLAATDAHLETAIAKHSFSEPLFQRLAGFQLRLPPLRKRREDFGQLVLHFLREELAVTGELDRLLPADGDRKPWLPAAKVARLAAGQWSGNVRALRNGVRQIVIASRGESRAQVDEAVEELADGSSGRKTVNDRGPLPLPTPIKMTSSRESDDDDIVTDGPVPWDISNELLLETLRQNNWSPTATAAALKIPRTKLYTLMDRHPDIRKASSVPVSDLLQLHRALDGNLDEMANQLRVSRRGLQLRMSQLQPPNSKTPR